MVKKAISTIAKISCRSGGADPREQGLDEGHMGVEGEVTVGESGQRVNLAAWVRRHWLERTSFRIKYSEQSFLLVVTVFS